MSPSSVPGTEITSLSWSSRRCEGVPAGPHLSGKNVPPKGILWQCCTEVSCSLTWFKAALAELVLNWLFKCQSMHIYDFLTRLAVLVGISRDLPWRTWVTFFQQEIFGNPTPIKSSILYSQQKSLPQNNQIWHQKTLSVPCEGLKL